MKKIKTIMILCISAMLLLFAGCKNKCEIDYPKNIKPIDWENYNDVYTVYWNYHTLCSEIKVEDADKEIMLSGWVRLPLYNRENYFNLVADVAQAGEYPGPAPTLHISIAMYEDSIRYYLDTCDITRKCFIKGRLDFDCYHMSGVCDSKAYPTVHLLSVKNIYFE